VDMNLRCFTYKELVEATDGFKEELGKGAFGVVYKGVIQTGSTVLAINGTGGHGFFFQPCSCGQPVLVLFPTSQSRLEHVDRTFEPLPRRNRWTSTSDTFVFTFPKFLVGSMRGGEPFVLKTECYWCRIFSEVPAWAAMFKPGQRSSWLAYGNNGVQAFLWCFEEIRVESQVFCSKVEEIK